MIPAIFHSCAKPIQWVDWSKARTLMASSLHAIANRSSGLKTARLERAVEKMTNKLQPYNDKIDSALAKNDISKLVQLKSAIGKQLIQSLDLKLTVGNDTSRQIDLRRLIRNQNQLLVRCNDLPSTVKSLQRLSPHSSPEPVMYNIESALIQAAERRDEYSLRAMRYEVEKHYWNSAKPLSDLYIRHRLTLASEHFEITRRLRETLHALRELEPITPSAQLPRYPV